MRTIATALLASALAVLVLAPSAHAQTSCALDSIVGTYVFTLGGFNATTVISNMSVVAVSAPDGNGVGTLSGTLFANEFGERFGSVPLTGSYQMFSNCFLFFFLPDTVNGGTRWTTYTGYVFERGSLILIATPFDPLVQVTGAARRVE